MENQASQCLISICYSCLGVLHTLQFPCASSGTSGVVRYLEKTSGAKLRVIKHSLNRPGSWWRYDLGENCSLLITHCTLTRNSQDPILGKWVLKASTDGRKWRMLTNKAEGNHLHEKCLWSVGQESTAFRYFEIRQNGKNIKNSNSSEKHAPCGIFLSSVELYGTLRLKKRCPQVSRTYSIFFSKDQHEILLIERPTN